MIKQTLSASEKDLGEFTVRRLLPVKGCKNVGPFVFFDHFGPVDFGPGQGIDVRPHPHIGLSTVTYLIDGEILHRDNLGVVQSIKPGEINLMVAGKGIVHSERTAPEVRSSGQKLHGLQLWIALPAADEESDPAFYHYDESEIPELSIDGCRIKVLIGSAFGLNSPVLTHCSTLYIECHLDPGASLDLPEGVEEMAIFVISGQISVGKDTVEKHAMAVLDTSNLEPVTTIEDSHFVITGGESLGKRHVYWNFVSTSQARIEQAKTDWQQGNFSSVPEETDFIPLPDS